MAKPRSPATAKPAPPAPPVAPAPAAAITLGADPDPLSEATHSGHVDVLHLHHGVRGWAVSHINPAHPVRLELCVGARAIAETLAEETREDISHRIGRPARAGFAFPAAAFRHLLGATVPPDAPIRVRIATTGHLLPSEHPAPAAGALVDRLRAEAGLDAANATGDFPTLLRELRAAAAALLLDPARNATPALQGYIETLAPDPARGMWFIGWMKRGHLTEFSAAIVQDGLHPAAVAVLPFARADLAEDCCGVLGLIDTDWTPPAELDDLSVIFGAGGRFQLRAHAPLRWLEAWQVAAEFDPRIHGAGGKGRAAALHKRLAAIESWSPARGPAQDATACSLDRVLLVPGLGCLVEGWVMSPMKRVRALRLRLGAQTLTADTEALFWKPRPDLLSGTPASARMAARAGFVGLFTGPAAVALDDTSDPLFKVVFEDATSANWPVAPAIFRRLGFSAGVEDATRFFPALQEEVFFPRFARAAIAAERGAMAPPVALSLSPAPSGGPAWVFVLPDDRCDLFLLFEELARQLRAGAPAARRFDTIAFISATGSSRSDALWLFREFQAAHAARHAIAASLFVVEESGHAFTQLPHVLAAIGAARFVFVGPGIALNPSGWAQAAGALAQDGGQLSLLAVDGQASARCFAWSTAAFAAWLPGAPAYLGGFHRDNGLSSTGAPVSLQPDAAFSTRPHAATAIAQAVNDTVHRDHAAARKAQP